MRPYLALARARFAALLQYRAVALAGFATQLFWGFIRIMIFDAFYRSSAAPQPMAFDQVVTYVWLSQATLVMLPWNADGELRTQVRSGGIAYELVRPLGLFGFSFARAVAWRTAPALLRALPMFLVAIPFLGMGLPPSPAAAAAWVASLAAGVFLSSAFTVILSLASFWLNAGEGVANLVMVLLTLGAGLIVPLPLFPDRLQPLLNALPFRGLLDVPCRIYAGHIPVEAALPQICFQLAWAAALAGLGWVVARAGVRRLVVQGG
ncbi:MAG: ABC-2 family transporter protein [bacterium]